MTHFLSLALTLIFASAPAWANPSRKTQEIYPATQSEGPLPVNPSARKKMNVATPSYERTEPHSGQQLAGQAAPDSVAPQQPNDFDPVPQGQMDAMGRRLKLVETLIRLHGRAYDYRSHTVAQLEAILHKLEDN